MNSFFHEPAKQLSSLRKGTLTHFPVFEGIELSFTNFIAEEISLHHSSDEHILEINYCHSGIIGWDMKNNTSVYLNPGDLEIHTLDCCASSVIHLPLSYYEGITVLIDPQRLDPSFLQLFREWNYEPQNLISNLCPFKEPLSLSASLQISSIFSSLYSMPDPLSSPLHPSEDAGAFVFSYNHLPKDHSKGSAVYFRSGRTGTGNSRFSGSKY